jgi:hypothetical protein
MIRATIQIMFPRPFVFERHELVHVHRFAVQKPFVFGVNAFGEVVGLRPFVGCVTARHNGMWLTVWILENELTMPQVGILARPIS